MNTSTIKSDLHKIIDEVDDQELLGKFYHEVLEIVSHSQNIWKNLSKHQQKEVLEALEESKDRNNLIDHKAVMKKYKQWL